MTLLLVHAFWAFEFPFFLYAMLTNRQRFEFIQSPVMPFYVMGPLLLAGLLTLLATDGIRRLDRDT